MAITISVGKKAVEEQEKEQGNIKYDMKIRKTLDGNLIILDHEDIDIIIMPEEGKILTLVSDLMNDKVYDAQSRMFRVLVKKGVVSPETVKGGNVYGSMEGVVLQSKDGINSGDVALMVIADWIEKERPHFEYLKAVKEGEVERLTEPDDEDSTELGEIPAEKRKGSMDTQFAPSMSQRPF